MNNKFATPQSIDRYFQELDAVYMDPIIRKVFDQISVYNELLKTEFITGDELLQIVNELDAQWMFLMNEKAEVTGNIDYADVNDESENPTPITSYFENETVVFDGVVARKLSTIFSNGNLAFEDGEDYSTYELRIRLVKEGITESLEVVGMLCSASVQDIVSLEFEKMMSAERAKSWLSHFHADVVDEIDIALLNPSQEECEMVMRLRDLELNTNEMHDSNSDMSAISKVALGVYVETLFKFDKDMPYLITASGGAWRFNEMGGVTSMTIEAESLARVHRLIWQPAVEDDEFTIRPILEVSFFGADKDTESLHMLVPLKIVTSFKSMRHDYFYGYEPNNEEN